ncbi:MAG: YggT family protein [Treponema sp.]|jgi:YggT family protein|nr:YggT family protein [Treponema sp.]
MRFLFSLLAAAAGLYTLLIFIRVIISWFGNSIEGKPVNLLASVTDPYLDWWRRALNLRLGSLDLSPVAGIACLSLVQNVFNSLSHFGRITLGYILAVVLRSVWSAVSFILGFCLVILILRMIAYLSNRDVYSSPFWNIIDTISQPVLYRINRIFFGGRVTDYLKRIVGSTIVLAVVWIGGGIAVSLLASFLARLPL